MKGRSKNLFCFGPFRLDTAERLLLRDGQIVTLTPKVFDTLVLLVQRSGRLLERKELLNAVWADSFVEEANLTVSISTLRRLLGKQADGLPYIETVPKRGYRFAAEVREFNEEEEGLILHSLTRSIITIDEESDISSEGEAEAEIKASRTGLMKRWTSRLVSSQVLASSVVLIGLIVVAAYWWKSSSTKQAVASPAAGSIAVLPFKQLSGGESDDFIGLGIADVLITRLGHFRQITVRPTSAVQKYTDSAQDLATTGQELNVDSVLEGSVQRSGELLRLTARLVRVRDGELIWAGTFDGKYTKIFDIQDAISKQMMRALGLDLAGDESLLTKHYTENTQAQQAYIKGRYFLNTRTEEGLKKAIKYFGEAIEKDAGYTLAKSGLADSHVLLGIFGISSPREAFLKAKTEATEAVSIDETLAEAHISLAYAKMYCDWDWLAAEREFKRGIELKPNYATAHHWYSEYLAAMGRFDEALEEMKRAQDLDPHSLIINANLGWILYLAHRYDEAIAELSKTLEMDPTFYLPGAIRWQAYVASGMYDEAMSGSWSEEKSTLGEAYAASGPRGWWQVVIAETLEKSRRMKVSSYYLAQCHAQLGENDRALKYLERAYEDRDLGMICLKVDPLLDSLRSDARLTVLLARVGFPLNATKQY